MTGTGARRSSRIDTTNERMPMKCKTNRRTHNSRQSHGKMHTCVLELSCRYRRTLRERRREGRGRQGKRCRQNSDLSRSLARSRSLALSLSLNTSAPYASRTTYQCEMREYFRGHFNEVVAVNLLQRLESIIAFFPSLAFVNFLQELLKPYNTLNL